MSRLNRTMVSISVTEGLSGLTMSVSGLPSLFGNSFGFLISYHLNNTGELATNRDIPISEHGDIETFTPTY